MSRKLTKEQRDADKRFFGHPPWTKDNVASRYIKALDDLEAADKELETLHEVVRLDCERANKACDAQQASLKDNIELRAKLAEAEAIRKFKDEKAIAMVRELEALREVERQIRRWNQPEAYPWHNVSDALAAVDALRKERG